MSYQIRHNSRIVILQKLFEIHFLKTRLGIDAEKLNNESLLDLKGIADFDELDTEFINKIVKGVEDNKEKIDKIITKLAPEWPINNIALLDLQILRMAIFEGFISEMTPAKVVIDEAIELAKDFSNDQSRKFVSGVLGALYSKPAKNLIQKKSTSNG